MKQFDLFDNAATKSSSVSCMDLIEEIMPLLKDCFVGEITLSERGIEYRMNNGQSFIITVQAV